MDNNSEDKEIKRLQKVEELLKDLNTGEEAKVKQALKGFKVHGDISIISPLINHWSNSKNEIINQEIASFINDLKQTDSAPIIMDAIRNSAYKNIKSALLNTIWNSKVDYSEHLAEFVNIAVDGNFMEALECLTIIESMEGPFKEHQFLDAKMKLSKYANTDRKNDEKAHIMSEIALIIKTLEAEHID
jgi:hypothetical protein